MNRLTMFTAIPKAVKRRVWERDHGRCILCGSVRGAAPNAHFIARSQLGLGIDERNIVTLCMACHTDYDNSAKRKQIREQIRNYLKGIYGDDWEEGKLVYKKWMDYKEVTFNAEDYDDWELDE